MATQQPIEVVAYDPTWPALFAQIRDALWPVLADVALTIEHVGSTAVPGLAAKPIIDMSVVVPSERELPLAIARLATRGYQHLGNLGIEGREAFRRPPESPRHNLYVCPQGSTGLRNHLAVRDYLRAHPDMARAYGDLKQQLAARFPTDIDRYVDGKTDLILTILRAQELSGEQLAAIGRANRLAPSESGDAPGQ
jgi:GrpB-like predicted nucleotidyltransferase (UPF0157 family)